MSFYPTSSPSGSHYLPLNDARKFISETDSIAYQISRWLPIDHEKHYKNDEAQKKIDSASSVNFDAIPKVYEQAKENLRNSLEELKKQVQDTIYGRVLQKAITHIFSKWANDCILETGQITKLAPFTLTDEDWKLSGIEPRWYAYLPRVCSDFTFYLLNEEEAFPYLFAEPKHWPEELTFNAFSFFEEWGYQMTTTPRAGDLVGYFTVGRENKTELMHTAIWLNAQSVLSKWDVGDVYAHPIESIFVDYGHYVYFFHKSYQSDLIIKYLKEIKSAAEKVVDFSHPACRSPLSLQGCKRVIFGILNEIPNTKKTFERGMYNREFQKKLKDVVLKAMDEFPIPSNCQTKHQLLYDLQKLVQETADKVTPSKIYGIPIS